MTTIPLGHPGDRFFWCSSKWEWLLIVVAASSTRLFGIGVGVEPEAVEAEGAESARGLPSIRRGGVHVVEDTVDVLKLPSLTHQLWACSMAYCQ